MKLLFDTKFMATLDPTYEYGNGAQKTTLHRRVCWSNEVPLGSDFQLPYNNEYFTKTTPDKDKKTNSTPTTNTPKKKLSMEPKNQQTLRTLILELVRPGHQTISLNSLNSSNVPPDIRQILNFARAGALRGEPLSKYDITPCKISGITPVEVVNEPQSLDLDKVAKKVSNLSQYINFYLKSAYQSAIQGQTPLAAYSNLTIAFNCAKYLFNAIRGGKLDVGVLRECGTEFLINDGTESISSIGDWVKMYGKTFQTVMKMNYVSGIYYNLYDMKNKTSASEKEYCLNSAILCLRALQDEKGENRYVNGLNSLIVCGDSERAYKMSEQLYEENGYRQLQQYIDTGARKAGFNINKYLIQKPELRN